MANTPKKNQAPSKAKKPQQGKQPPKKQAAPKPEQVALNRQKTAIIIAGAAVLFGCLAFIEGESGWAVCHDFVFRILGVCAYILPFILAYIAFVCTKDRPDTNMTNNVVSASGLLLFITAAIHIFRNTAEYFTVTSLAVQIKDVWEAHNNGGVIGAILGGLICKLLGRTGAGIIAVVLLVVFVLLVTGTTLPLLASYVKKPVKKVGEATSQKFEQNARRREELREQREKEEEERRNRKPPELPTEDSKARRKPPVISVKSLDEPAMPATSASAPVSATGLPKPISTDTLVPAFQPEEDKPEPEKPAQKPLRKKAPKPEPVKEEPAENPEEKFTPPAPIEKSKGNYVYPPIDCLELADNSGVGDSVEEMQMGARKLVETLESFKIRTEVTGVVRGPSVTRYELVPDAGVRISKITSLSDDIALRLAAKSVRIEAPIPGKSAIGIEVPNSTKSMVSMREVIDTDQFRAGSLKSKLNVALGKDITGNIITADLAKMPHLLVAGTTGSGKSVCLNTMIISILYNSSPDEVKLLMIDPKQVEFTVYNGIAHLAVPVVSNPRKAAGALSWAVSEMEKRYAQFAETGVRDIKGYNKYAETRDDLVKMHHIVIFIDELSDLMMASPKEVEDSICRLAQMARAAGIHLVIATQRPSVDVITGIIKANIPSRIALYVSSIIDSRTILDQGGAEKLLGNGDMLFNPVGSAKPTRVQGCYISDEEVETVVSHIKSQSQAEYDDSIMQEIEAKAAAAAGGKGGADDGDDDEELDPMFNQAAEVVVLAGQASTTMLQKKLKLGYARASRVMDQLEENGIVGAAQGAKPRDVLITKQDWYERQALGAGGATPREEQLEFDTMPSYAQASADDYDEYEEEEFDEEYEDEEEAEAEEAESFEYEEPEIEFIPEDETEPEELEDFEIEEVPEEIQETYYEKIDDEPVEYEDISSYSEEYEEEYPDDFDEDDRLMSVDDLLEDDDSDDDEDIDDYFN